MEDKMEKRRKRHLKIWAKIALPSLIIIFLGLVTISTLNSNILVNFVSSVSLGGDLVARLKELSQDDQRINNIIQNIDAYPKPLLEMLSRDIDLLDFVIDYPQKYGQNYNGEVDDFEEGSIPLFLQWDQRWGYAKYGDSSIAISGCGPTSLAMVIVGLTKDKSITPYQVATYASQNGYYLKSTGTSWSLMTTGATHFGVKSIEIPLDKNIIYEHLSHNSPIICSMGPGDFTTTGHFIVLTKIVDGKIKINDSNSKKRSSVLWDYEEINSQIKNLWAFSL